MISKELHINKSNNIHLVIAPTKLHEKIDLIIEKVVEIGVQKISFVTTDRTIRNKINIDRIKRITISAMKQSGQFYLPIINNLKMFNEIIENTTDHQRFIAHLEEEVSKSHIVSQYKKGLSCCIIIGPEGDFTREEIKFARKNKFIPVSLGNSTLRTETAAIYSVSAINTLNEQ